MGMGKKKKSSSVSKTKKKKSKDKKKKKTSFNKIIQAAKKAMTRTENSDVAVKSALQGARVAIKNFGGKANIKVPRLLPIPSKIGGALPLLIPISTALSAIGGIVGGASGVIKTVNDANAAKKQLEESKRHNKVIESITLGKGLYMRPYKNGAGFYFNPKNS